MPQDGPDLQAPNGVRQLADQLRTALKQADWRTACSWAFVLAPLLLWRFSRVASATAYALMLKLPWLIAVAVILTILFRGLTQSVTVEPVSVPKELAERGYTPEVASVRLKDAMLQFVDNVNTQMPRPDFALQRDLPNVVVPSVGISLNAVLSSIKSFLQITNSRDITGEMTIENGLLWLRLRIDGKELFSNKVGGDPQRPDDLMRIAAPTLANVVAPYHYAASFVETDPQRALQLASENIERLDPRRENERWHRRLLRRFSRDDNLPWFYILRSHLVGKEESHDAAAQDSERAYESSRRKNLIALVNWGVALREAGQVDLALKKFEEAIEINPDSAIGRYELGSTFAALNRHDRAVVEYDLAIEADRRFAAAPVAKDLSLQAQGKKPEAVDHYRKSNAASLSVEVARMNLGTAMAELKSYESAVAEYRQVIHLNSQNARAQTGLGLALAKLQQTDAAVAAMKEAIKLDAKQTAPRLQLAEYLFKVSRIDGAISEYRAVLEVDPDNRTARERLELICLKPDVPACAKTN